MSEFENPFQDVPQAIIDLCHGLTDFVNNSVGFRPDYSSETLPLVDHYLHEARASIQGRPELLDLVAQSLGAYFGEVVRRHLGGFWQIPTPNPFDFRLCGTNAYLAFNPIGVGYEVLMAGGEHSGPSSQLHLAAEDRAPVEARLESLPEEREEDYYRLSTRYEVMEIIVEAVRVQAEARGYTEMLYTDEDYPIRLAP